MNVYDYFLPHELIANRPASPRDSSRVLVYNTQTNTVSFDTFLHIGRYIAPYSVLVLNKTKVLPARVEMKRKQGKVKVLFLVNEIQKPNKMRVFVDRKVEIGDILHFDQTHFVTVVGQEEHIFTVAYNFSVETLFSLLEHRGTMPIPLYIKKTPLSKSQLKQKYQTIFAQDKGSAAAPTAALHFTNRVFRKLEQKGIQKTFVTLHVGMGTLAPVTEKNMQEKKLHEEWFEVPQNTIKMIGKAKKESRKIVAVGTTVVRTLESVRVGQSQSGQLNRLKKNTTQIGKTDLFIYPPYTFQYPDCLITNFHLPGTSLMMLVEAFLQYKGAGKSLVELYKIAIGERLRFYSFGDAMLIK